MALGLTDVKSNLDLWKMIEYALKLGIRCNFTTSGLDVDEFVAKKAASLCGAIAVSVVQKEKTYDAVKLFTDAGLVQTNIHFMLALETFDKAKSVVDDIVTDSRLAKLNAIVFLGYKMKGRKKDIFHPILDPLKYRELFEYCLQKKVRMGLDSCSSCRFLKSVEDHPNFKQLEVSVEPCESGLFSSYVSVDGDFYPCSFTQGEKDWEIGIPVLEYDSFLEVWQHPRVEVWRQKLLSNGRKCPVFNLDL